MKDDRLYLIHILERMERIRSATAVGREEFFSDAMVQEAVAYSFQIIGEATKRLTAGTRARAPHIPWRETCLVSATA